MLNVRNYILVIAEKPKAARKIAEALNLHQVVRVKGVSIWVGRWNGKTLVVAPAAGHLYTLDTDERGYPTFNYKWVPRYIVDPEAKHTKRLLEALALLAKNASEFVNACDYDVEGSLIGFMIIKHLGDPSRAKRVKFSSLTPQEIRKAFASPQPLDMNMVNAGYCRHVLDWLWGVNISRFLMDLYQRAVGTRRVLSAGRVQTPTLAHAVDLSLSRRLHVPTPKAYIEVAVNIGGKAIKLRPAYEAFDSLTKARECFEKVLKSPYARIVRIERRVVVEPPPHPFNLPDLQSEAHRLFKLTPYTTQKIAEELYLEALISYPRTLSQRLPDTLNHKEVLERLAANPRYSDLVESLIEEAGGMLRPNNGPLRDPAHPAIYPTGTRAPYNLGKLHEKIYDLIVRRYLATFAKPAEIAHITAEFQIHDLKYTLQGAHVIELGWLKYYPYVNVGSPFHVLEHIKEGMEVRIENCRVKTVYERPPQPPSKYYLFKWMEKVGIGTEATRAEIVELLFKRGYLSLKRGSVEVSDLGIAVVHVLRELVKELTEPSLTRIFEEYMKAIMDGKKQCEEVLNEANGILTSLLEKLIRVREDIAAELYEVIPFHESAKEGGCPICGRKARSQALCIFHSLALQAIEKHYDSWRRFGFSWRRYLERLAKMRSAGQYVREVAQYIMLRGAPSQNS